MTVKSFCMDIHPVTTVDFEREMETLANVQPRASWLTVDETPMTWSMGICTIGSENKKQPVNCVNWYAAHAYCQKLGKRLPTEAEWEFAARAGTDTPFWWGEEPDAAHCPDVHGADVVTQGPRCTPAGVCDMLGQWQWTQSLHRPYPYSDEDGRNDPDAAGPRVTRGVWCGMGNLLKYGLWDRAYDNPEDAGGGTWFRCALSL